MDDSIGCKIGNFQTEGNVIMRYKHSNKSVLFKPFHLQLTNTKIINQYHTTYTIYTGLNHVNYLNNPFILSIIVISFFSVVFVSFSSFVIPSVFITNWTDFTFLFFDETNDLTL